MAPHDGALDLFCASPPPGLESDGNGPDHVKVTYEAAPVSTISDPEVLSATSPTLCPPELLLPSTAIIAVADSSRPFSITVVDRDLTPHLNPQLQAAGGVGQQPVSVKVVSSRVGEPSDTITLQQASSGDGTFTGIINVSKSVSPGAQDDGIIHLEPGDSFQAIYFPVPYIQPRSPEVKHVRTWVNCSLRLLPVPAPSLRPSDESGENDVSVVPLDEALTIEITDADADRHVLSPGEDAESLCLLALLDNSHGHVIPRGTDEPWCWCGCLGRGLICKHVWSHL